MIRHVFIHAGRHKTGTTALQAFLAENDRHLLERFGLLYPLTGRDTRKHYHHHLFTDLIEKGDDSLALLEQVGIEAKRRGATRVVLSSEILSRRVVTSSHLEAIRRCVAQWAHTASIVLYVRRQDSFLESSYAERVKRGFLRAPQTIRDLNIELDYERFVGLHASVFGHPAIKLRTYERAVHEGLFVDFLEAIEVPDSSGFNIPVSKANRRLPWLYIYLLRHANRWPTLNRFMRRKLIVASVDRLQSKFPALMDSFSPLSVEDKSLLLDRFERTNHAVARAYLGRDTLF